LDNILFDARTGELVHVDYNIVFGRGQLLHVPEVVPFRLTQTLKVFRARQPSRQFHESIAIAAW
jgi:phosphatidylinositol kinase/protein kinase (PI-3  family)